MTELRLIAGSGRSGTTWVLDALAEANALRPIFEPLHPETSPVAREFANRYFSRDDRCDRLEAFLSTAADNSLRSVWTSYRIRPGKLRLTPEQFRSPSTMKDLLSKWKQLASARRTFRERERRPDSLVKCIRANLMLDWIRARFAARIVLLIRHPGAVVESQLRFAEHWDPFSLLRRYAGERALMSGPLASHRDVLAARLGRAEALTAIWCIENIVPAAQAAANGYEIVFYEALLEDPDREWRRMASALGLPVVPGPALRETPSQQAAATWQRSAPGTADYARAYGGWRNRLSAENSAGIQSMLDAFGVSFYAIADDRPDADAFRRSYLPG